MLPTPEQLAGRIIAEITADIELGKIPSTVQTVSELHDYVDANCYGGTEQLLVDLDANSDGSDKQHTANLNTLVDLMNSANEIVGQWLKSR